jgi:hypothetical protein
MPGYSHLLDDKRDQITELRPKGFDIVCHLQQRVAAPTLTASELIGSRRAKGSRIRVGALSFP